MRVALTEGQLILGDAFGPQQVSRNWESSTWETWHEAFGRDALELEAS